VPKPTSKTFSFFFNDLVMTVSMASMAPAASVLERLVEAATAAIKSCLFTGEPPMIRQLQVYGRPENGVNAEYHIL